MKMRCVSHSEKETLAFGKALARKLRKGDIVCLYGDLGAGKTVLTRGIAIGYGVDPHEVISPTFVLLREYRGSMPLYHFDLYRLKSEQAIAALGYEEYFFGDGISIVEWPSKLGHLMPRRFIKVDLAMRAENERLIQAVWNGPKEGRIHETKKSRA